MVIEHRYRFLTVAARNALAFLMPLGAFSQPHHPLILQSQRLQVTLDRDRGLPFEYRLVSEKTSIHGEGAGRDITITVFRSKPRSFDKVTVRPESAERKTHWAVW